MTRLSLTGRQWILQTENVGGSIVDGLLKRRNIDALGEGELLDSVGYDARLLPDFEKAAGRIEKAIDRKETVAVFGDYDCDGITGSALLTRFLRRRGIQPLIRLPHRLKEGYGLRSNVVDEFSAAGVTLLLTVDTGVTAVEPITHAASKGMDVIVLDHHTLPAILPPAYAILHPSCAAQQLDGAPCGAGVAWSVISALEQRAGRDDWDERATDIALAAIGTVADIVELRGGNRTLTHSGLLALAQLKNGPLALLCAHAGLTAPYTSRDIGFRIAPRINAAGRMADPHIALHALLGDMEALLSLDALNRERQDVVAAHLDALLPIAEMQQGMLLCFAREEYSPGICGLLAGRICETFGKPALVASCAAGECTASLRSVRGYDITAGLTRASDLLISYGGHAMAAGCTFAAENLEALRARLEADLLVNVAPAQLTPTLEAECVLMMEDLTIDFTHALQTLEPYGAGNPEPRFIIEDVVLEQARCVGKDEKHLQASVRGRKLIGFGLGHALKHAKEPLDLLFRVGIDTWRGARAPQLFLDDVRIAEKSQAPNSKSQAKSNNQL